MINALQHQLTNLKVRFELELRQNPRIFRLLWVCLYIVFLYLIFGLYDRNHVMQQTVGTEASQLARHTVSEGVEEWYERLEQERHVKNELLALCWNAPSSTLASADMQTRLQRLSATHKLDASRLSVAEPVVHQFGDKKIWVIRAQISGKSDRARLPIMIDAIENGDEQFVIERMQFSDRRSGSINLLVTACFIEVAA